MENNIYSPLDREPLPEDYPMASRYKNCMRCIALNRPTPFWLIRSSWQDILSIWEQVQQI